MPILHLQIRKLMLAPSQHCRTCLSIMEAVNLPPASDYLKFYKYLPVLSEHQLAKIRKIAIGILSVSAFSDEEVQVLEVKLHLETQSSNSVDQYSVKSK